MITVQQHYVGLNMLTTKNQAMECVLDFIQRLDRELKHSVSRIYAYSAQEFCVMENTLRKKRIDFTASSPYTLLLNELSEHTNYTILDKARALLRYIYMTEELWRQPVPKGTAVHSVTITDENGYWKNAPYTEFCLTLPHVMSRFVFSGLVRMCTFIDQAKSQISLIGIPSEDTWMHETDKT